MILRGIFETAVWAKERIGVTRFCAICWHGCATVNSFEGMITFYEKFSQHAAMSDNTWPYTFCLMPGKAPVSVCVMKLKTGK